LEDSISNRADTCHPALCALGSEPHRHCPCGLPMAVGATLCDLCLAEGFRPRKLKPADHLEEWDGVSYPSLRLNRPTDVPTDRYDVLLLAIFDPQPERIVLGPARNAQPATSGQAA